MGRAAAAPAPSGTSRPPDPTAAAARSVEPAKRRRGRPPGSRTKAGLNLWLRPSDGRDNGLAEQLDELAMESATLPDYDTRTPDEIIGYEEHGVPR